MARAPIDRSGRDWARSHGANLESLRRVENMYSSLQGSFRASEEETRRLAHQTAFDSAQRFAALHRSNTALERRADSHREWLSGHQTADPAAWMPSPALDASASACSLGTSTSSLPALPPQSREQESLAQNRQMFIEQAGRLRVRAEQKLQQVKEDLGEADFNLRLSMQDGIAMQQRHHADWMRRQQEYRDAALQRCEGLFQQQAPQIQEEGAGDTLNKSADAEGEGHVKAEK
eukprot:gnl/TRDRNA2_/TRDRNA2_35761_c0_seq1.p1 gnl/TRDRNA2_/TRDRNA2_35761_c0~~gnl/TRDRNA2_/TRDRNA2_35761_c0_seq1.p1  ORF type:complete len:233 (+),score=47.48 gnl/TRDRNA2_/TRDRNA2_35761_c0_seq1:91-789(+)